MQQEEKIEKIKKAKEVPYRKADNKYREMFSSILSKFGGRLTEEREILLRTICKLKGHFKAEDVYDTLKKQGHKVSLATVYRNLSLIVDAGIINRVSLAHSDSSHTEFECVWDQQHHDHLICMECGKKVEFTYPAIEVLQEAVATEHGFKLKAHHLDLLGICSSCQSKEKEEKETISLSLLNVALKIKYKVVRISGGKLIAGRLHDFGLHNGCQIKLVRIAPFGGPLLIEDINSKSKIMVARKLAKNVFVEEALDEE